MNMVQVACITWELFLLAVQPSGGVHSPANDIALYLQVQASSYFTHPFRHC